MIVPYETGHFYLYNDRHLLQYRGRGQGGRGPKRFVFLILATQEKYYQLYVTMPEQEPMTEVPFNELPLYIGFKYITPVFERIMKRGNNGRENQRRNRSRQA